jgi:hypothetical protein
MYRFALTAGHGNAGRGIDKTCWVSRDPECSAAPKQLLPLMIYK